jgi:nicotinamidase-related amidase
MTKKAYSMTRPALLIIDMQKDFVLPNAPLFVQRAPQIIPQIATALSFFREKALPVFHIIRHYRKDGADVELMRKETFKKHSGYLIEGTEGAEIVPELTPLENEYVVIKRRFSAFMGTELDFILRRLKINKLFICGVQYPLCIRTTVFDGVALDYEVCVLTDCTAAQSLEIETANLTDIKNIGVSCLNSGELAHYI